MTLLSHSPTDMPDWRAASRAASRASGRRPLKFHGPPDFIARPNHIGRRAQSFELLLGNRRSRGHGVLGIRLFKIRVNKRLRGLRTRQEMALCGNQPVASEPGPASGTLRGARWNRAVVVLS